MFVGALVTAEPGLMSLDVLRRARLAGYGGGKSALYALIASLRPPPTRPIVRFEGLPEEFCGPCGYPRCSLRSKIY